MPERKPHLRFDGFREEFDYESKHRPPTKAVPLRDRQQHGTALLGQYTGAIQEAAAKRPQAGPAPITEETGIYLELIGQPGQKLPLAKLDSARDYRLQSMHLEGDSQHEVEAAVIFVPDSRRAAFERKLQAYLDPRRDTKKSNKPANQGLIDSIALIRLAHLRSFWTDHPNEFPADPNAVRWWELWLSKQPRLDLIATAQSFADRVGASLGNTAITFHDSAVVLIRASAAQLEQATELISCLAELRKAKETPAVFAAMRPQEQRQWADDLLQRVDTVADSDIYVSILDTGVNYTHPLLATATAQALSARWNDAWPHFSTTDQFMHHGSEQAGLALFGDLIPALLAGDRIALGHGIESGRILPPLGVNDPELYGAITVETAAKLEAARPESRRIFSMAVTATSERQGGQPSSWSSKVDSFCAGETDGKQRLFVISAGNNRDLLPQPHCWDQSATCEIEDPAQSWNALTVGAYTQLTTNDDAGFAGWSPFADNGDLSPRSRTSLAWPWRKQAPFKPDVVEEGGNVLLSPSKTDVSDSNCVSLLTTSGRSTGQLFATTGATSAATALVSRQLALLVAEHPGLWPETHRALLVHSADWTDRMYQRKGQLEKTHSEKVANEDMLRIFGHGVPNLERALYSANHALTLIAENEIQPYKRPPRAAPSKDATLNEMHLHELPWPKAALEAIDPDIELRMKVTLSYFVEPNPGRRGYRDRFSYPSHGLRFQVIRPEQSLKNFQAAINKLAGYDDYDGPEGDGSGWRFGPQLRTRGSLHSDVWTGPAAQLARMNAIAVYPVSGWWKSRKSDGRWNKKARYSLVVSIESPDQTLDIYTEVSNTISAEISV